MLSLVLIMFDIFICFHEGILYYLYILVIVWSLSGHILIMFIMLSLFVSLYCHSFPYIVIMRSHFIIFIVLSSIFHYIVSMMSCFYFHLLVIILPTYCQCSLVCQHIVIIVIMMFFYLVHMLVSIFSLYGHFHYVVISLSLKFLLFCHHFVIVDYVYFLSLCFFFKFVVICCIIFSS